MLPLFHDYFCSLAPKGIMDQLNASPNMVSGFSNSFITFTGSKFKYILYGYHWENKYIPLSKIEMKATTTVYQSYLQGKPADGVLYVSGIELCACRINQAWVFYAFFLFQKTVFLDINLCGNI